MRLTMSQMLGGSVEEPVACVALKSYGRVLCNQVVPYLQHFNNYGSAATMSVMVWMTVQVFCLHRRIPRLWRRLGSVIRGIGPCGRFEYRGCLGVSVATCGNTQTRCCCPVAG
jgi:hypothetical protein